MSEKLKALLKVLHYNLHKNKYSIGSVIINKLYHSRMPSMDISKTNEFVDKEEIQEITQRELVSMIAYYVSETSIDNIHPLAGLTIADAEKLLLSIYDLDYDEENEHKESNGALVEWLLIRNEYTHGEPVIDIGLM